MQSVLPRLEHTFYRPKPKTMLFGVDSTFWFVRKTCCDNENEKSAPNCRNLFINHNQAQPKLRQKRQKLLHLYHLRVDSPLVDTANAKFISILIFYLSAYKRATWSSQSPKTVSIGLLTLEQIQLLWLPKIRSKNWQNVPNKIVWQLRARCCLKHKTFWTTI